MNKRVNFLSLLFLAVLLLCTGVTNAQNNKTNYLVGAVPVVDGKVTFTKDIKVPGKSQSFIYDAMLKWMKERMAANGNKSRVAYADATKGEIVAIGNEWIVFNSSFLSLDRTDISYQLYAQCSDGKCMMTLTRIKYNYREGEEKYDAESWITDKIALNKSKTKIVRGLVKWRTKTIDFVNGMFKQAEKALNVQSSATAPATSNVKQWVEISPNELGQYIKDDMSQKGTFVLTIIKDKFNTSTLGLDKGISFKEDGAVALITFMLKDTSALKSMNGVTSFEVNYYPEGSDSSSMVVACQAYNEAQQDGNVALKVVSAKVLK